MITQRSFGKPFMRGKMDKTVLMNRFRMRCVCAAMVVAVWWLFFVFRFVSDGGSSTTVPAGELNQGAREQALSLKSHDHSVIGKFASRDALSKAEDGTAADTCEGKYIYVQDSPIEYHEGLLEECGSPKFKTTVCDKFVNMGFGLPFEDSGGVFPEGGWYATSQFALEVIFHNKMKKYRCRTMDSSKANAIFVPFYPGVEVMPHLNLYDGPWEAVSIAHRDQVPTEFAKWLTSRPEWSRMYGHDHFFVVGRVTWDFRRLTDNEDDWGNSLLHLAPVKNMTTLTIESSPWSEDDFAVPYPTYFHPSTYQEVYDWQGQVAKLERKSLFCFAGAPRPEQDTSIRGQLMSHCKASEYCNLMECTKWTGKCQNPADVMRMFMDSQFCLQPVGDSFTRRSIFDSILAGCIPVLFHSYSAYAQYVWFLPADPSSYSVFINQEFVRAGNVSIEEVLRRYSAAEIEAMRKVVISLIPRILYSNAVNNDLPMHDAFEISVEGVINRILEYQRDEMAREGKARSDALRGSSTPKEVGDAKQKLDAMLRGVIKDR